MSLTQKDGIQHPALYMNFHSEATHRLISFTDETMISQYCWHTSALLWSVHQPSKSLD